ncbi:MAG: hypothetical protein SWH61_01935 [Thermodesulfobacteriota bacterium]|nr:hypothetical protein [Thermodesulfobacteriota bacterium]
MTNPDDNKDLQQIMTRADELLAELDTMITEDLEEQKRIPLEKAASKLKKIKADPQKAEAVKKHGSFGEGIHEAIDEVIKAMKAFGHHDR